MIIKQTKIIKACHCDSCNKAKIEPEISFKYKDAQKDFCNLDCLEKWVRDEKIKIEEEYELALKNYTPGKTCNRCLADPCECCSAPLNPDQYGY